MADSVIDRDPREQFGDFRVLGATAATNFPLGVMIAQVSGLADSDSSNMDEDTPIVGVCMEAVDNSSGLASAVKVKYKRGVFGFNNSGTDAVDAADVGNPCYVEDNQTVKATKATTEALAGYVVALKDGLVMVRVGGDA